MTTLAWDGKTLAADTLASNGIKWRFHKLYRLPDGSIFGGAGSCQEILAVLAWLRKGEKPADLQNFEGLIITKAGVSALGMRLMREPVLERCYAVGSGSHFAIAAMACGKNAVEAVRIAARFDPGTGGRVETLTLRKK